MNSQLIVDQVCVNYGNFAAVREASLLLDQGQIGCLLGPSGCGKTSLLRAIAGFEPVAAGTIELHGQVISASGYSLAPEQRRVGMVFQDFALFPHLSISRNVAFGLGNLSRTARQQRVDELLQLVGLGAMARAYPHELSGGQQQRVALARALAPSPEILLLDEPFSSLDSELREQLAAEVRVLLKENKVTAILVTHDQHEAFAMADHVTLLQAGRVAQSDTPYNLYHNPASEFVAGFIGQGTIINTMVSPDGKLAIDGQDLPFTGGTQRAGQTLRLLVRPDDIQYDAHSQRQMTVSGKSFRGGQFLYELALADGQRVPCLTPSHVDIPVGNTLPIRLDLRHLVLFENGVRIRG